MREHREAAHKAEFIRQQYEDYRHFVEGVNDAAGVLESMLSSKSVQDTVEAVRTFKLLRIFGFQAAEPGLRKMLTLLFSKDDAVAREAVETYEFLYFARGLDADQKTANLLRLMKGATLTDLTCLEELLKRLLASGAVDHKVTKHLISTYAKQDFSALDGMPTEEQRARLYHARLEQRHALQILRMITAGNPLKTADAKGPLMKSSLEFARFASPDFILIKEAVMIFQCQLASSPAASLDTASEDDKRYIFTMMQVLMTTFGTIDTEWLCAAEAVLNAIFGLRSRNAHEYARMLIERLSRQMAKASPPSDMQYTQLFFVVGHVAIKMLAFVDMLENDLKKAVHGRKDEANGQSEADQDLAQVTGGHEAEIESFTQTLSDITEEKLIQEGFLGQFLPQIKAVCQVAAQRYAPGSMPAGDADRPQTDLLARAAIMALCKMMSVSARICKEHLALVFQLLSSRIDFGAKSNIIISLGDLFNRFPNLLNEHSTELFSLLHDEDRNVRRQALLVITHLIMNDMLKLKQELVDICMLMHDQDAGIGEQARLFLHELHGKDNNQIYNLFPNLVQRLAGMELTQEKFDGIVKTLVEYISKEKQKEAILEKMLHRLRDGSSQEWRTIGGVLPHLRFTERMLSKTAEQYECWKERMLDQNPLVRDSFRAVIANCRKLQVGNAKMKSLVDELERAVNKASG